MVGIKSQLFRAGLSALWYSGAARTFSRWTAGKGALLMLHRVQPGPRPQFAPNARLSISPAYLHALLASFRAAEIDVLTLDQALARMHSQKRTRRFVCFTFDDGYRDNLEHALPLFQRFRAPFAVYATTRFAERTLAPWWYALEDVISRVTEVRWIESGPSQVRAAERFAATSIAAKERAFAALSERFITLRSSELTTQLQRFLDAHGRDMSELAAREMCSWSDLRALQAAGVEIGCHAISHPCLRRETSVGVREQLEGARDKLESELGRPVRHLAYPYGKPEHVGPREFAIARDLGFTSAVTTCAGTLFPAHAAHLHALPRIEVTQTFAASPHYLQTILTGLPLIARRFASGVRV